MFAFQVRNRELRVRSLYPSQTPEKHLGCIQQAKRHRNLVLFPF